jgi:drug/metabolite transporter (DMT)-like permease
VSVSNHLRANLALLLCSVIWGTTFVVVQNALLDSSVLTFLAVRFTSAAILIALFYRRSLRGLNSQGTRAGILVGLFMFSGYIFQTIGLKFTTASKAAFLTGSSVVLVPLLLVLCRQQRVTRWVWWGAASAFAGLYLLTIGTGGLHGLNKGDPLVFISAFSFALQIIFIGRSVGRVSAGAIGFLEVSTTAVLSVLLLPIASATHGESMYFSPTRELLIALLITSIGGTVICLPLQVWAQQYASPSHAAIILSLEPVFAAVTSYFVQGERMGLRELCGAALILAGILFAEHRPAGAATAEVSALKVGLPAADKAGE